MAIWSSQGLEITLWPHKAELAAGQVPPLLPRGHRDGTCPGPDKGRGGSPCRRTASNRGVYLQRKNHGAAWHSKPSWYIVASNDNMIAPKQETSMAKQINAKITVLPSSHVAIRSRTIEVAKVIENAAAGKK